MSARARGLPLPRDWRLPGRACAQPQQSGAGHDTGILHQSIWKPRRNFMEPPVLLRWNKQDRDRRRNIQHLARRLQLAILWIDRKNNQLSDFWLPTIRYLPVGSRAKFRGNLSLRGHN